MFQTRGTNQQSLKFHQPDGSEKIQVNRRSPTVEKGRWLFFCPQVRKVGPYLLPEIVCLERHANAGNVGSPPLHVSPSASADPLIPGLIVIDRAQVSIVSDFKFLGVPIDSSLSGEVYFRCLRGGLSAAIGALVRVRHVLPPDTLVLLYHAFFSSFLSYGVEAFGLNHSYRIHPIEILQKRAVRVVAGRGPRDHTAPLFRSLEIFPYRHPIKYSICVLVGNCGFPFRIR